MRRESGQWHLPNTKHSTHTAAERGVQVKRLSCNVKPVTQRKQKELRFTVKPGSPRSPFLPVSPRAPFIPSKPGGP